MDRSAQRIADLERRKQELGERLATLQRIRDEQQQLHDEARAYLARLRGRRLALAEEYQRVAAARSS